MTPRSSERRRSPVNQSPAGSPPIPVLIAVLTLALICCGCTLAPATSSGAPPVGMVAHHNAAKGYTLAAPESWTIQVQEDQYLAAQEKNGLSTVII